MLRYAVLIIMFLASPALAGDEFLIGIFDADGPTITRQIADGPSSRNADAPIADECEAFDSELPVTDPCSGWVQTGEADFGNGPEPVYSHRDDMDETDTGDPRCAPERFGTCPELLPPEDSTE